MLSFSLITIKYLSLFYEGARKLFSKINLNIHPFFSHFYKYMFAFTKPNAIASLTCTIGRGNFPLPLMKRSRIRNAKVSTYLRRGVNEGQILVAIKVAMEKTKVSVTLKCRASSHVDSFARLRLCS